MPQAPRAFPAPFDSDSKVREATPGKPSPSSRAPNHARKPALSPLRQGYGGAGEGSRILDWLLSTPRAFPALFE
ncbi:MAG: hypothetical protein CMM29_00320 [Rhodospirillaceae bacterium]|nr:hypothetical protein [Rhodospirillaceae bacterium]